MEKTIDVVVLGEVLVDFAPLKITAQGEWPSFQALPGGAPANFLAVCANEGLRSEFIGAVGQDFFGQRLVQELENYGIGTAGIELVEDAFTTLAFVSLAENGERDFAFARKPGADSQLRLSAKHRQLIAQARCFHFGTISQITEPAKSATLEAVKLAKENACWINFDPNYRAGLWPDEDSAREAMLFGIENCRSLKISKEELLFLYKREYEKAVQKLQETDAEIILVTDGSNGSELYWRGKCVRMPAFVLEDTVDTTGAGDIFGGAVLAQVMRAVPESAEDWREVLQYASAYAALSTCKFGGLASIPKKTEVEEMIQTNS